MLERTDPKFSIYHAAIIENTASRILRLKANNVLAKQEMNITHWAIMGLLKSRQTMNLSELAVELKLDPPFVTNLIHEMKTAGYVGLVQSNIDKRAKILSLTQKALDLIPKVEKEMIAEMLKLVNGVESDELTTYFKVLNAIIRNGS